MLLWTVMHLNLIGSSTWHGYPVAIWRRITPRAKTSAEAAACRNLMLRSSFVLRRAKLLPSTLVELNLYILRKYDIMSGGKWSI